MSLVSFTSLIVFSVQVFVVLFFCVVLEIEARALCLLGECLS